MVDLTLDRAAFRSWLVSAEDGRWVRAIRRFAPELMPPPLIPIIVPGNLASTRDHLSSLRQQQTLICWDSTALPLITLCDQLIATADTAPRSLQIVAAARCNDRERSILLELPCAAVIRHPEELVDLRHMIQAYFH
jgi:hypothetical protein